MSNCASNVAIRRERYMADAGKSYWLSTKGAMCGAVRRQKIETRLAKLMWTVVWAVNSDEGKRDPEANQALKIAKKNKFGIKAEHKETIVHNYKDNWEFCICTHYNSIPQVRPKWTILARSPRESVLQV